MISRLRRDRRGNVALMVGFGAMALFGVAGLTIDATRTWMMRSRLATALDAAALAAARIYDPAKGLDEPTQHACLVFWANFGARGTASPCATSGSEAQGFLGAIAGKPSITVGANNTLSLSVDARLGTTFSRIFRPDAEISTSAPAAAIRTVSSLEIALALDVTASMYPDNKMSSLRTAAQNFITSIYGSQETRENTWVSITPYTTHVNIGTASYATAMVTPNASNPNTLFRAWFYPTTLSNASPPQSLYSRTVGGTIYYYPGDNDWRSYVPNNSAVNERAINEWALNQNTSRPGAPQGGTTQAPPDIT